MVIEKERAVDCLGWNTDDRSMQFIVYSGHSFEDVMRDFKTAYADMIEMMAADDG